MKGGVDPIIPPPNAAPADATRVAQPIVPPIGGYPQPSTPSNPGTITATPGTTPGSAFDQWNSGQPSQEVGSQQTTPLGEWLGHQLFC